MKVISLSCWSCGRQFERSKSHYNKSIARGSKRFFCSSKCFYHTIASPKVLSRCMQCNKPTYNPKFCSRSCSTVYNNRLNPKKKRTNKCAMCHTYIRSDAKYCSACWQELRSNPADMTLADYRQQFGSRNSYTTSVHLHAQKVAKDMGLLNKCAECGYTRHVQCCHIRSVASFSSDTKLSVVNAVSNLVGLCPTHHWEMDNGYLAL